MWKIIQKWAGVEPDGVPGPMTARAIIAKLGLGQGMDNPKAFFAAMRAVTGPLGQEQVDSVNAILDAGKVLSANELAYVLATAWHESRFKPQREIGLGRGKEYGKLGKYAQPQYGRGFVQLTWDRNYEWADKALGLNGNLLKNFDLALDPQYAARILVEGMCEGAFTGKKLEDYFNGKEDPVNARRIVNGTDRAELIAGYYRKFKDAVGAGGWL